MKGGRRLRIGCVRSEGGSGFIKIQRLLCIVEIRGQIEKTFVVSSCIILCYSFLYIVVKVKSLGSEGVKFLRPNRDIAKTQ